MSSLADPAPPVSPSVLPSTVIAGLLLIARGFLERFELPHPSVTEILEATEATRSRAYELKDALAALLPGLVQPMGRPRKATTVSEPEVGGELARTVLRYLYAHPGATTHSGGRRFYSDRFRRFVLQLYAGSDLDLEAFARAVDLPLGTLDGWLRAEVPPEEGSTSPAHASTPEEASLHIQTIIAAWRGWSGSFSAFVGHLKDNLRIVYGRSFVARVLFAYGERTPQRRRGRSVDEQLVRESFEVFFPDAQWVGDGMQVPVTLNGVRFDFNLELDVDAYSGAFVGASIRDEEDSQAVVQAFEDGVETTGASPLALLLDNRSSNHTEEVDEALGDTNRMRSTLGRAQNKGHVEGAFGLFSQHAPPIDVVAGSLRELARELLRLRVQTFFRTMNHRPRRDRNWQSRVDLHNSKVPTEDEVAAARTALEEQRKKRECARAHDLRRADPVVLRFLDDAFGRLGIVDPEHHARSAIARYGRDIVIEAISIFEGKKNANSLPERVDAARYILGIARNLEHVHEADEITQSLMRNRIETRDAILGGLRSDLEGFLDDSLRSSKQKLDDLLDRVLTADRTIDQLFWLDATGDLLCQQPVEQRQPIFRDLARCIHATFALRPTERSAIERRLARLVWPVS